MHYHVVVKENVKFFLDRLDEPARKQMDLAIIDIRVNPMEKTEALEGGVSGLGYFKKIAGKMAIYYVL